MLWKIFLDASGAMVSEIIHQMLSRDYTEGALDNLRCLLTGEVVAGVVPLESEESNINLGDLELFCKSKKSKVSQCTL
jgi:hypothetical protein